MLKEFVRWLGKTKQQVIQKQDGTSFTKFTVWIDNPDQQNKDGTPNQYHKGKLIWFDAATNKYYQIRQLEMAGSSPQDAQRGFVSSIKIDLENSYNVTPMD